MCFVGLQACPCSARRFLLTHTLHRLRCPKSVVLTVGVELHNKLSDSITCFDAASN